MTGMDQLAEAARLETARIYSQFSPEYVSETSRNNLADEVKHFMEFGWTDARIALRLRLPKYEVAKIRAAA